MPKGKPNCESTLHRMVQQKYDSEAAAIAREKKAEAAAAARLAQAYTRLRNELEGAAIDVPGGTRYVHVYMQPDNSARQQCLVTIAGDLLVLTLSVDPQYPGVSMTGPGFSYGCQTVKSIVRLTINHVAEFVVANRGLLGKPVRPCPRK